MAENIPEDMTPGTVHETRYGKLVIVKYDGYEDVTVKFLATGCVRKGKSCHIRIGRIKDLLLPSICGVGFVGIGRHKTSVNKKDTKIYKTWRCMIGRCYDKNIHKRQPTYAGCIVDSEWHNFQNFADWMELQDYDGKELDKDTLVKGNKIYSKDTCTFITHAENTIAARAKRYRFKSPEGEIVDVYNLNAFCADKDISQSAMVQVSKGNKPYHKGWTMVVDNEK